MGNMLKGLNYLVGGVRMIVAGFFGTIFLLIVFPTVIALSAVLSYGIFMLGYMEFWLLLALITAVLSVAVLVSKVVIPDISGE